MSSFKRKFDDLISELRDFKNELQEMRDELHIKGKTIKRMRILCEDNRQVQLDNQTDRVMCQKKKEIAMSTASGKVNERQLPLETNMEGTIDKTSEVVEALTKVQIDDELGPMETADQLTNYMEPRTVHQGPQMSCFALVNRPHHFRSVFTWTISDVKNMLQYWLFVATSEAFLWTGYPVLSQVVLKKDEDAAIVLSMFFDKTNLKMLSNLKFPPRVYYVIKGLNARGIIERKCRSSIDDIIDFSVVINDVLLDWTFNEDDSLTIEVYMEPEIMAQQVHSYNGTLVWAIEEYSMRLQLEEDGAVGFQESLYFYTSLNGFRVRVHACLKGKPILSGNWLTFNIVVLKGWNDSDLCDPLNHRMTISLVNRKCLERSVTSCFDWKLSETIEICTCEVEEVGELIENDTLYCKVTIE